MAKRKFKTRMKYKRTRMKKRFMKMKITFWRAVGALGVLVLVITIGGGLGMEFYYAVMSGELWAWSILALGALVVIYIGSIYIRRNEAELGVIQDERQDLQASTKEKKSKADRNLAEARRIQADANNSVKKTDAEVEIMSVEADLKRQDVVGKQIQNAKLAVDVELSKVLLANAPALIDKAINSEVPYALNAPGAFTLTAKVPRTITNNAAGELGPGEINPVAINYLEMVKAQLMHRDSTRLIVFGEQGSGKTTAAKWTLSEAAMMYATISGAEVYLLDPHAPEGISLPEVYGAKIMIIGGGMNYGAIRHFLDLLKIEIKQRYAKGCAIESNPAPPPKFIVCEEWTGLLSAFKVQEKKTGNVWWDEEDQKMLFMDARKAAIGYFLIVHSRTVASIGVSGNQDLLNGVDSYLYLGRDVVGADITHHSRIYTQLNEFKTSSPAKLLQYGRDVVMPGPYTGSLTVETPQEKAKVKSQMLALPNPKDWVIDLSGLKDVSIKDDLESSEYEQACIDVYNELKKTGKRVTKTAIARKVYSQGSKKYTDRVLMLLNKNGVKL